MKRYKNNESDGENPSDFLLPSGYGSSPDVKCSSQPSQRAFYYKQNALYYLKGILGLGFPHNQ